MHEERQTQQPCNDSERIKACNAARTELLQCSRMAPDKSFHTHIYFTHAYKTKHTCRNDRRPTKQPLRRKAIWKWSPEAQACNPCAARLAAFLLPCLSACLRTTKCRHNAKQPRAQRNQAGRAHNHIKSVHGVPETYQVARSAPTMQHDSVVDRQA